MCWILISFSLCRDYDREQFAENAVPLLLIGTKFDQIPENKRSEVLTRTAFLSEDFNAEEINLVSQHLFIPTCSDLKSLSAIKSASSLASLRCFGPAKQSSVLEKCSIKTLFNYNETKKAASARGVFDIWCMKEREQWRKIMIWKTKLKSDYFLSQLLNFWAKWECWGRLLLHSH